MGTSYVPADIISIPLQALRCSAAAPAALHGLANPIHNFWLARRLRGQYVLPNLIARSVLSSPSTLPPHCVCAPPRKDARDLRDGRKLHGVLRSYGPVRCGVLSHPRHHNPADPVPANLVLEDTVERIYHGSAFAESWHGLYLIRGENVVLLGENVRYTLPARLVVLTSAGPRPRGRRPAEAGRLRQARRLPPRRGRRPKKEREEVKSQILYEQKGFCKEGGEGDGY